MFDLTDAGYAIAGISVILAVASTVVRLAVTDMKRSREIREKLKEHQAELNAASKANDMKKLQRARDEMAKLTMENMRMAYRPLFITIIPFLLIFWWLGGTYGDLNPTYNVTVVDTLPGNVTILEAKSVSKGGNYTTGNRTLRWLIPQARSDTEGTVSAELILGAGDAHLLNFSEAVLTYVDENRTLGRISSKPAQPQDGALMTVKKDVTVDKQSNKAFYKVTYMNMMTNNVVFFPVYADVCVLFGVFHIHGGLDWFGWYFICSLFVSLIINQIVDRYKIELNFLKKKQTKVN